MLNRIERNKHERTRKNSPQWNIEDRDIYSWAERKERGMASEYLTEEEVEKIKKELLQVLRNHNLNSGLAKVVLTDTVETIEKYSQLPE